MVTGLVRRYTKRGELMATFVLEDLRASIEVFVFPKVMAEVGALLADDAVVVLRGRVDTRDDQVKLVCMEVTRPELAADGAGELRVELPVGVLTDTVVDRLKQLLCGAPRRRARLPPRGRDGPAPARPSSTWTAAGVSSASCGCCWARTPSWPERRLRPGPATCGTNAGSGVRVGYRRPHPVSWWVHPEPMRTLGSAIARAAVAGVGAARRARSRPCRLRSGPRTAHH